MYRPFLSYSELGSMLDDGPTKLHDAVSSVLGLDELTDAEKALRDARLRREKAVQEVGGRRAQILAVLEGVDDERARSALAALRSSTPDLDRLERLVTASIAVSAEGEIAVLQRVVAVEIPDPSDVSARADELLTALGAVVELAASEAEAMRASAALLEQAIAFVERFPTDDCPVCGTVGATSGDWVEATRTQVESQRERRDGGSASTLAGHKGPGRRALAPRPGAAGGPRCCRIARHERGAGGLARLGRNSST